MNLDNASSSQKVSSKYFSSNTGMDESLSDFQEKKIAAPKNTKLKLKPKKPLKRPRGQKDIRKALKSKKSDLETYAKDFDNVCKQSGIDVDSEELQLAIALSKSIQPSTSDSQSSESNSQERTSRIRSTLQEYGFTVPEIKISNANRRVKKHKKNYKLLSLSEAEKQQNIADRYSRVLLQNVHHSCSPKKIIKCDDFDKKLYFLTTNVCYEAVRDNNLYYLDNLPLEKSSHKGTLLRDWSKIPGRPVSPKSTNDYNMDVSEILCSQEELNIILSGALKNAKNVIRNKLKVCKETIDDGVEIVNISEKSHKINSVSLSNHALTEERKSKEVESINDECLTTYEVKVNSELARSCSPDIFDEELTSFHDSKVNINMHDPPDKVQIIEPTNKSLIIPSSLEKIHSMVSSQGLSQNITKRKSNDVMELTECVGDLLNPTSCATVRSDATKRRTNDFMDLTECVVQDKVPIDLTQNSDDKVPEDENIENIEIKDLTQSSSSNDSLPFVHVSDKNNDSVDDTIILNESEINVVIRSPGTEDILIEATPEVDETKNEYHLTSKTPPKYSINVEESSNDTFFEDFEYNHSNSPDLSDSTIEKSIPEFGIKDDSKIDLTHSPDLNDNMVKSEFELEDNNTEIDLTQSPEKNNETIKRSEIENKDNIEIDLTQNSSESDDSNTSNILTNKSESCNKSSLGKKDDVSIDYDEITCNASSMNKTNDCGTSRNIASSQLEYYSHSYSKTDTANSSNKHSEKLDTSQISNESEVFQISDRELNYSMHQSRYEDCIEVNFGGISIMDNNSNLNRNRSSENNGSRDRSNDKCESDSFLPEVNVKTHVIPKESCKGLSPIKNTVNNYIIETPRNSKSSMKYNAIYDIVKTPGNREYVIKTDQVTPIGDYMAMSTPDRNKELEKYGLKPLKRKRAIQLLTHIYNQTHPIVEPCSSEVSQSPTKKRKTEPSIPLPSPKKSARENLGTKCSPTKIPRKNLTMSTEDVRIHEKQISPVNNRKNNISPVKNVDIDHEVKENIYEMTTERVEIRDIECVEDDWVFQKREKAKLQTCRVPLHIAFNNYVSCRRGLREAILRYEPVNIDVIHKGLANSGHKYDPKDLLKFLDKKCITVKTVDNNPRNNRK